MLKPAEQARGQIRTFNNDWCVPMLTIDLPLLIGALLFGFVGGYAARDLKSRQRRRRFREKYAYGLPPIRTNTVLDRNVPVSASHGTRSNGALPTSHPQSQKAGISAYP
jgi:hypothetical protein